MSNYIHYKAWDNITYPFPNFNVTGDFPAQKASNAENDSIWWRHHEVPKWEIHYLTAFVRELSLWLRKQQGVIEDAVTVIGFSVSLHDSSIFTL